MGFATGLLLVCVAAAGFAAVTWSSRAGIWVLFGAGVALLIHAAATILLIRRNDNADPGYRWMNSWMLFATVPAGLLLLCAGSLLAVGVCCLKNAKRHGDLAAQPSDERR